MSRLEELIQELCPNGVAYKTLGEVLEIQRGKRVVKRDLLPDGKYPVYQNSLTPLGYYEKANVSSNTTFVIVAGAAGEIGFSLSEFWAADDCFALICPENILNRYVYHFILGQQVKLKAKVRKASIPRLSRLAIEQLQIPVPPLEVQREIVRILDHFTELTTKLITELITELTARKKQYEYYASTLISNSNYEWVYMSELAKFVYGYTDKARDYGDARFIRITDIDEQGCLNRENVKYITLNDEARKSLLSKGDLIMARTGATYGKTLFFDSAEPSVYASFLIKIIPDSKRLNNKYYWHFTKTSLYWNQANKLVSTGGQPQFNTPALKKIKIPLPSLEEQQRIVDILDRFDTLCNDLTAGLPAEIEARRKQYEYYRDKLLTFEPLAD